MESMYKLPITHRGNQCLAGNRDESEGQTIIWNCSNNSNYNTQSWVCRLFSTRKTKRTRQGKATEVGN